jgi:hypothetical protein
MLSAAHVSDSTATDFITKSLTVEASKKHRTKRKHFTAICTISYHFQVMKSLLIIVCNKNLPLKYVLKSAL